MKQLNLSHALITLFVVYWTAGGEWVLWVANLYRHLQCCYWNVAHTSSHEFVSDKDLKRWQGLVASQKLQCLVRQSTNTKGFKFFNIHFQQHWPLQSQYTYNWHLLSDSAQYHTIYMTTLLHNHHVFTTIRGWWRWLMEEGYTYKKI